MSIDYGSSKKYPQAEWHDISDNVDDCVQAKQELNQALMDIENAQRMTAECVKQMIARRNFRLQSKLVPPKNRMVGGLCAYESIGARYGTSYTAQSQSCTVTNDGSVIHQSQSSVKKSGSWLDFIKKLELVWKHLFPKKEIQNADKKEDPEKSEGGVSPSEVQPKKS